MKRTKFRELNEPEFTSLNSARHAAGPEKAGEIEPKTFVVGAEIRP